MAKAKSEKQKAKSKKQKANPPRSPFCKGGRRARVLPRGEAIEVVAKPRQQ
ncbi:hypothetical protein LC55x_1794 [Lysobacter capsici]|nr:hypothetical protein LC55x_1794 [Lysobacter capsici]